MKLSMDQNELQSFVRAPFGESQQIKSGKGRRIALLIVLIVLVVGAGYLWKKSLPSSSEVVDQKKIDALNALSASPAPQPEKVIKTLGPTPPEQKKKATTSPATSTTVTDTTRINVLNSIK